jgi:hypothetical protein
MNTLGFVVFLGKFLVSQKLGVHASLRNILGSLGLLDTVGVSLVGFVVRTSVLLLLQMIRIPRKENNNKKGVRWVIVERTSKCACSFKIYTRIEKKDG